MAAIRPLFSLRSGLPDPRFFYDFLDFLFAFNDVSGRFLVLRSPVGLSGGPERTKNPLDSLRVSYLNDFLSKRLGLDRNDSRTEVYGRDVYSPNLCRFKLCEALCGQCRRF